MTKSWLEDLKAKFPALLVGQATPSASNANKQPRDALLALIQNSLSLLDDANFTISKRGKPTKPEACFKMHGGMAEIVLRYAHEKLTLPNGGTAMTVPVDQLPQFLEALMGVVKDKAFDDQLESIKAARVAAQKKGSKLAVGKKKVA